MVWRIWYGWFRWARSKTVLTRYECNPRDQIESGKVDWFRNWKSLKIVMQAFTCCHSLHLSPHSHRTLEKASSRFTTLQKWFKSRRLSLKTCLRTSNATPLWRVAKKVTWYSSVDDDELYVRILYLTKSLRSSIANKGALWIHFLCNCQRWSTFVHLVARDGLSPRKQLLEFILCGKEVEAGSSFSPFSL